MRRVVVRTPPRRRASARRRTSASCVPARGNRHFVTGLVLLLAVSAVGWWAIGHGRSAEARAAAPMTPGLYVAIPHPATPEMRREAAYLSRRLNLRQIEEPGAPRVEIRRFQ
jgi:hypothetical protein